MAPPRAESRNDLPAEAILPHLPYLYGCAKNLFEIPYIRHIYGDIDDVFQSLCLAAVLHGLRLWDPAGPTTLQQSLAKCCCWRVRTAARSKKGTLSSNLIYTDSIPDRMGPDALESLHDAQDALEALSAIRDSYREIVDLHDGLHGHASHTFEDVAEILNLSRDCVAARYKRTIKVLRGKLKGGVQ